MDVTPEDTRRRRPAGTARRRGRRDRRDQLAAIAADLFRRNGYHNVGVGDIAAAAGITGPAVYRHFRSKQAILGHVVLSGLDSFASVIHATLARSADTPDPQRLALVAASIARLVVERRELGALLRREGRNLPPADRAELGLRARAATRFGAELIQRVRPLPDEDADLLCWSALSVFGSVSDHHVTLPKARFQALLTDLALAVAWSGAVPRLGRNGGTPSTTVAGGNGGTWRPPDAAAPQPRREQLLTLAARMFCEHGFHAVTMEEIGAAAGISGPSIYRHYAGKADLLVAMCNRVGAQLRAGVDAARSHPAERALRELTGSFVHTVLEYRDLVAAYLIEGHNLPDRHRTELRQRQRQYIAEWVALLTAVEPGLDEKQAKIRLHAAFTVVNDLARTGRFAARPRLPDELAALASTVLAPGSVTGRTDDGRADR